VAAARTPQIAGARLLVRKPAHAALSLFARIAQASQAVASSVHHSAPEIGPGRQPFVSIPCAKTAGIASDNRAWEVGARRLVRKNSPHPEGPLCAPPRHRQMPSEMTTTTIAGIIRDSSGRRLHE